MVGRIGVTISHVNHSDTKHLWASVYAHHVYARGEIVFSSGSMMVHCDMRSSSNRYWSWLQVSRRKHMLVLIFNRLWRTVLISFTFFHNNLRAYCYLSDHHSFVNILFIRQLFKPKINSGFANSSTHTNTNISSQVLKVLFKGQKLPHGRSWNMTEQISGHLH